MELGACRLEHFALAATLAFVDVGAADATAADDADVDMVVAATTAWFAECVIGAELPEAL